MYTSTSQICTCLVLTMFQSDESCDERIKKKSRIAKIEKFESAFSLDTEEDLYACFDLSYSL